MVTSVEVPALILGIFSIIPIAISGIEKYRLKDSLQLMAKEFYDRNREEKTLIYEIMTMLKPQGVGTYPTSETPPPVSPEMATTSEYIGSTQSELFMRLNDIEHKLDLYVEAINMRIEEIEKNGCSQAKNMNVQPLDTDTVEP